MTDARSRFCLLLTTGALALQLVACHGTDGASAQADAETLERALAPREVSLIVPKVREEQPTLRLVGEIRAFDMLTVSPEVDGRVDRVHVEVGDRVARGTALLEVDRKTYEIRLHLAEADLAAARAGLDLAAKALERKRDLRSDETVPQAVLDEAQASHDLAVAHVAAADAGLELARRNFERSIVRAPTSGAVTRRSVVAGQWADIGAGMLEIAVGSKVKVAALVPEAWAERLTGLESFSFSVGGGGSARDARVYSVQPAVDEASRSFEIVGTAANDGALRPGMFASVVLVSPTVQRSLWLTADAVATSDLPQVLLAVDGQIAARKVRIGRRVDGMVEIVSGLAENEAVIADVSGLHRGLPVRIIGETPEVAAGT